LLNNLQPFPIDGPLEPLLYDVRDPERAKP